MPGALERSVREHVGRRIGGPSRAALDSASPLQTVPRPTALAPAQSHCAKAAPSASACYCPGAASIQPSAEAETPARSDSRPTYGFSCVQRRGSWCLRALESLPGGGALHLFAAAFQVGRGRWHRFRAAWMTHWERALPPARPPNGSLVPAVADRPDVPTHAGRDRPGCKPTGRGRWSWPSPPPGCCRGHQ